MIKKTILVCIIVIILLFALTGCIPGDGKNTEKDPAGFFWGVWHGWIAPISLIGGIFNKDLHVYETFNNGWWYDFGFYIAIISGFGGISLSRMKRKKGSN